MRAIYTVPGSEQPRTLACESFDEAEFGVRLYDVEGEEIAYVTYDALVAIEPE